MIFHVRPIPSCPRYFVSDMGRVWGPRLGPRKELKLNRRGPYLWFGACLAGRQQTVRVAYAVAEAFLGPKPHGAWVCHRNDKPHDNRLENLYYGDASTNARDAYRNGRRRSGGEGGSGAKLTWEQVDAIRLEYGAGLAGQRRLARRYSVTQATISKIVRHLTWRLDK